MSFLLKHVLRLHNKSKRYQGFIYTEITEELGYVF